MLAPAAVADRVRDDLVDRLSGITVGNPAHDGVRMGPLATAAQLQDVRDGVSRLARDGRLVFGQAEVKAVGAPADKGFFSSPVLIEVEPGAEAPSVHGHEVFGPAATVVPYSGAAAEAVALVARGQGGLVSSIYSEDVAFTSEVALGLAPFHGRVPSWAAPRSPSNRRDPAPCCRSSSTADRAGPAAERSWAGSAASRSICSAWPSRGRGR